MKNYWFSFSYRGKNNGVCLIKADSEEEAKDKLENLKLTPEYDDMYCTEVEDMSLEGDLDYNVLYSPEEMIAMGYHIVMR